MVAPGDSTAKRVWHRRPRRQRPVWRRDEAEIESGDESGDDSGDESDDEKTTSKTIATATTSFSSTSTSRITTTSFSSTSTSRITTTSSTTTSSAVTVPPPPPPSSTLTTTTSSSSSSSSSSVATIPPLLTTSPVSTTTSPVPFVTPQPVLSSSEESISTVWLTATASTTSSPAGTPPSSSVIVIGQQDGDNDHDHHHRASPNNSKFAIAFGVVGAVGFLVGLIWAAMLIRRRRRQRNADQQSVRDYASTIGRPPRSCNLPFALPFLGKGRATSSTATPSFGNNNKATQRSDASILDEAIRAAYGPSADRDTFSSEKQEATAPILNSSIRQSLVSWFKRSSAHHPLKLSPGMARWSRSTRASSVDSSDHPGTNNSSRVPSQYTVSSIRDSIPPVPPLNLPSRTTAAAPVELPAEPEPTFTRDDAQAYYKTVYYHNEDAGAPGQEQRMSTASSWTDATRSTMRVSTAAGGPPLTGGLAPPTYYSNRSTLMAPTDEEAGTTGTGTREELYALYGQIEADVEGGRGGRRRGAGLAEV